MKKKAETPTVAQNFMTDTYIVVPHVSVINNLRKARTIYKNIYKEKKSSKEMASVVNKSFVKIFKEYFEFSDALKLESLSDEQIIESNNYFYLYHLAEEFHRVATYLFKISDFCIDKKCVDLINKNKKILKRLVNLNFDNKFSEQKITEYHDRIYYLLLSTEHHLQSVYSFHKDFISGLKSTEKSQEYLACIVSKTKDEAFLHGSAQKFFLCSLYNHVQNYEKSFSLFKEASESYFNYIVSEEGKKYGLSPDDNYPMRKTMAQLLESALAVLESKKTNLIEELIREIPKLHCFILENKLVAASLKQMVCAYVDSFYQKYIEFLNNYFNLDVDGSRKLNLKKRCLIFNHSNVNLRKILEDLEIEFTFNKNPKQYVISKIHLIEFSKLESLFNAINTEEEKQQKTLAAKIAKSTPKPATQQSDDNNCNNNRNESSNSTDNNNNHNNESQSDIVVPEMSIPVLAADITAKKINSHTLKASELGFDAKYDKYEIYEIKKRGVDGVFYGFFKPAKKLRHGSEVTPAVLDNHHNILKKEKTAAPFEDKGTKWVSLDKDAVSNYRQELKQEEKNCNNNNSKSHDHVSPVNLTLKTGFTFKTKDPDHDLQFIAKVKQVVENKKTGKQKILFKFWQTIKHKENVMTILTSKLAL